MMKSSSRRHATSGLGPSLNRQKSNEEAVRYCVLISSGLPVCFRSILNQTLASIFMKSGISPALNPIRHFAPKSLLVKMLGKLLSSFLLVLAGGQVTRVASSPVPSPQVPHGAISNVTIPSAPGYTFLYSANASISDGIDLGTSPYNHRIAYPITGGGFNGPNMTGNLLSFHI